MLVFCEYYVPNPGLEAIKTCSTQLSMKLLMLITIEMHVCGDLHIFLDGVFLLLIHVEMPTVVVI